MDLARSNLMICVCVKDKKVVESCLPSALQREFNMYSVIILEKVNFNAVRLTAFIHLLTIYGYVLFLFNVTGAAE